MMVLFLCNLSQSVGKGQGLLKVFKLKLLVQGKIKPVIAERMPLAEVRRAHELIERAEVQGKIVLTV